MTLKDWPIFGARMFSEKSEFFLLVFFAQLVLKPTSSQQESAFAPHLRATREEVLQVQLLESWVGSWSTQLLG